MNADLETELRKFLQEELVKCQDISISKCVEKVRSTNTKKDYISQLVESWTTAYQQVYVCVFNTILCYFICSSCRIFSMLLVTAMLYIVLYSAIEFL